MTEFEKRHALTKSCNLRYAEVIIPCGSIGVSRCFSEPCTSCVDSGDELGVVLVSKPFDPACLNMHDLLSSP